MRSVLAAEPAVSDGGQEVVGGQQSFELQLGSRRKGLRGR